MGFKFPENRSDLPSTSCLNNTFNCKIRQGYKFFAVHINEHAVVFSIETSHCQLKHGPQPSLQGSAWTEGFSVFECVCVCVCVCVCLCVSILI